MNREKYEHYLALFNDKDYDGVLEFWAPEFQVIVQGQLMMDSPESLKNTYAFMHKHVEEEVLVDHYLSDDDCVFMEARIRIRCFKTMTQQALDAAGVAGVMPIEEGVAYDIPQIIHYHLQNGRFKRAVCVVTAPPVLLS